MARGKKPVEPLANLDEILAFSSALGSKKSVPLSLLSRAPDFESALKTAQSMEGRKRVAAFLKDQARGTASAVKRLLGLKRGRPVDSSKRRVWVEAAKLRLKDPRKYSWSKLARMFDSKGYALDARRATDRMRQGICWVSKRR